jgi:hypothetical protein
MAKHPDSNTSSQVYALNASYFSSVNNAGGTGYLAVSHFSDIPFVFEEYNEGPIPDLGRKASSSWAGFRCEWRSWWKEWVGLKGREAHIEARNLTIIGRPGDEDVMLGGPGEK